MFRAHQIFKIFITENQQILIILKLSDICQPELAWFGIPNNITTLFFAFIVVSPRVGRTILLTASDGCGVN